jgi:predicted RNase H-like HicB family nuclease
MARESLVRGMEILHKTYDKVYYALEVLRQVTSELESLERKEPILRTPREGVEYAWEELDEALDLLVELDNLLGTEIGIKAEEEQETELDPWEYVAEAAERWQREGWQWGNASRLAELEWELIKQGYSPEEAQAEVRKRIRRALEDKREFAWLFQTTPAGPRDPQLALEGMPEEYRRRIKWAED